MQKGAFRWGCLFPKHPGGQTQAGRRGFPAATPLLLVLWLFFSSQRLPPPPSRAFCTCASAALRACGTCHRPQRDTAVPCLRRQRELRVGTCRWLSLSSAGRAESFCSPKITLICLASVLSKRSFSIRFPQSRWQRCPRPLRSEKRQQDVAPVASMWGR